MPRLSIKHTLHESLKLLLREWHFFISIIIGPVLLTSGATMTAWLARQETTQKLLIALAYIVMVFLWVRLAVCCHRFILLGEQPNSLMQVLKWKMRDTWFVLYGVAIYIFASFLILLTAFGIGALTPIS